MNAQLTSIYFLYETAIKEKEKLLLPIINTLFSFAAGGATSIPAYQGTSFAKKGIVFVSAAYRMGPLGFLAHTYPTKVWATTQKQEPSTTMMA